MDTLVRRMIIFKREMGTVRRSEGMTLIELLVIVAIITVLIGIVVPAFRNARHRARQAVCMGNLKDIGVAIIMYCNDYDDHFPYQINYAYTGAGHMNWLTLTLPYLGYTGNMQSPKVLHCPAQIEAPQIRFCALYPEAEPLDMELYKASRYCMPFRPSKIGENMAIRTTINTAIIPAPP